MKKYKLIKDLPTFKAGDEFVLKEDGNLYLADLPGKNGQHWKENVMAYHRNTLEHFPKILGEWFEEIEDSGSWKPKRGDEYYWIGIIGGVFYDVWRGSEEDEQMYALGNCFRTREEAEKAKEKLKAWKRLKDRGFEFTGYHALGCGDIHFISDWNIEDEYNKEQRKSDLDLLFGGEE